MSSSTAKGAPQEAHPRAASSSRSSSESKRPAAFSVRRSYSHKKESMNGPLYMQTCNSTVLVRRVKRKGDGPSKQLARWFVENQIGMPCRPPHDLCPNGWTP